MLREQVLREWEELKDKMLELDFAVHNYRLAFVIEDKWLGVDKWHAKHRVLSNLGIPEQIVANRLKHVRNFLKVKEDGTTERVGNIETQVSPNLSYNIFGRTFSASEMVVLLWGEIKRINPKLEIKSRNWGEKDDIEEIA